ncbi:MAG: anhydro-N-acetylmuramic acid kinase [Candidatus Eisenbacteria bacterium]|nr:anhydro-N-acetylmuramic acid kinase [Candidatus Eisenbacteria bacterium]
MSGTSHDAVDAALVRIADAPRGPRVSLERFESFPLPGPLRERIRGAPGARLAELARLHYDLGEAFANAALRLIENDGRSPAEIDILGSHGQTVYHEPPGGGRTGATLQLGEGDVIARRTGILTVSDFRAADVAAGGSGAPLIPLVDWFLFRKPGHSRLMLNLGGIANVTFLGDSLEEVIAFDTGPGNALLDEIMSRATDGAESFDRDGRLALEGEAREDAVEEFLRHPYFAKRPPKSTGKELFGNEAARRLARMVNRDTRLESLEGAPLRDLLATAALVTARGVSDATRSFLPRVEEVVASGGGTSNRAIMECLRRLFDPVPVVGLEALGMDPDAKEAVGFAVLARETLRGRPGNLPGATGALARTVLGKISPAPLMMR